jgi:hypothetical protein
MLAVVMLIAFPQRRQANGLDMEQTPEWVCFETNDQWRSFGESEFRASLQNDSNHETKCPKLWLVRRDLGRYGKPK